MCRTSFLRRLPSGRRGLAAVVGLASASIGCSVAAEGYDAPEAVGSTQAVLQIQRVDNQDGSSRGDALAGFVRLPASAEPARALGLAGLGQDLPSPGQCRVREFGSEGRAVSELSRIDLLDAESVQLITSSGTHELAPHAFPTVTDWIRGVVHTSRDRDAAQLPAGETYRWKAQEIEDTGSLDASFASPALPSEVTVGGVPWTGAIRLTAASDLDFTWSTTRSAPGDLIWIVFESQGRQKSCAFNDADGAGSISLRGSDPRLLATSGSTAELAVHRVRSLTEAGPAGLELVSVRFDFSVATRISFE